ncbi:MAG: hypothetical protein ACKOEE_04650 [Tagaea sp.]
MPVLPIPPPLAVTQSVIHHPQPQPQTLPQANVAAQTTARAQTAKGLKQGSASGGASSTRNGTNTAETVDSDANALGAKSRRRGGHKLDVEI